MNEDSTRKVVHLIRDVLDMQLVGRGDEPMGRVDGLLMVMDGDKPSQPPRIAAIENGLPVLARRVHPRIERLVRGIGRRIGVRRGRVYRIGWRRVVKLDVEIAVDVDADRSPALVWEHWLRRHVTRHIPGAH